jgi:galactokinase
VWSSTWNIFSRRPSITWSDYVVGVARELAERGIQVPSASLLICGDVPSGAGLSSSASLEVSVCQALLETAGEKIDGAGMARLCQRAENEFVGARRGIMDQFVSVYGRQDHALLLDCRSLEYRHLPIPEEVRLVMCNTMVRHSVAGGEYNQRRRECELAADYFSELLPEVKALRDVSVRDFEEHGGGLPEIIRKRCRHVIAENARALSTQDVARFGQLMKESHASLRDDFQVSCRELDMLVELGDRVQGAYGSRMTGRGFGGCTIHLVRRESVGRLQAELTVGYEKATGIRAEIYVCTAADGVRSLA